MPLRSAAAQCRVSFGASDCELHGGFERAEGDNRRARAEPAAAHTAAIIQGLRLCEREAAME